jgi:hypothetical protein
MTGIAPQTELTVELLAKGLPQAQVAQILEMSVSSVNEIAQRYSQQIQDSRIVSSVAQYEMDQLKDTLEHKALQQLERCLPLEMDPTKLVRIAQSLNGMTRRTAGEHLAREASAAPTMVLNMPVTFVQHNLAVSQSVVLNSQSQVVAIGEQTTAPASRAQIERMAAAPAPATLVAPEALSLEDI